MVALVAFIMIVAIVALLLKGKMSPIVVLAVIPTIAALILGFSPVEVAEFMLSRRVQVQEKEKKSL